jgi:uncharacterized protein (DUF2236 family)
MACPAGYTSTAVTQEKETPYEKPKTFPPIAEPKEILNYADEGIFLLGGQYAILCQFAHPGLAQGTFEHSNFASRILNRLQTTSRFLNVCIYGTAEEKEAILSVIHRAHSSVKGDTYSADDPELHKWTAATLFVSFLVVHEAFFGKLSYEKMETLFKESAIYGTSLRMPPEMWPATLDDFWMYWNHNIETLEVTDWARSLCKELLHPKQIPIWLKPMSPTARLLTTQWLPERLCREYGLKISNFDRAMYHYIVGYISMIYPHLPRKARTSLSRYYMKDLKKAVKEVQTTGVWSGAKFK